jgi:hypothetical protein
MTTHMPFDPYLNEETTVEIRHRWEGAVPLRRARRVVVNVTKDDGWVREGVLSDYPQRPGSPVRSRRRPARRTGTTELDRRRDTPATSGSVRARIASPELTAALRG